MMDKSILEKRIHDKAEERADEYFEEISDFFYQHEELVADGREGLVLKPIAENAENMSIGFRSPYQEEKFLFNNQDTLSKYTNWQDIRKELVEKYEKEETDNVLDKLDSINYLKEHKNESIRHQ